MEQLAKEFGNYMNEGSAAGPEYTPEQTTGMLMAFIDQMQVDEEQKARLRTNLLERLMNPDAFQMPEDVGTKGTFATPQDILKLFALLMLVFGMIGKSTHVSLSVVVYKVHRSFMSSCKYRLVPLLSLCNKNS